MKTEDKRKFLAIQEKMLKILDERDELENKGDLEGVKKKEKLYKRALQESIGFYDEFEIKDIFDGTGSR